MRGVIAFAAAALLTTTAIAETATGFVFHDLNGDRQRGADEPGLPGIGVSNGEDVVLTGEDGRYELAVNNDTILFVIKPTGWQPPMDHNGAVARFYYIHKPEGSPDLDYDGVAPTGPLPESVDFPLVKNEEPEAFKMILLGDPQPRNQVEIDWLSHDVYEEILGTDAMLGATLGDILFDGLELYPEIIGQASVVGIPWLQVIGNHDINFDGAEPDHTDETFERYFGPSYYSANYGGVHFLVLNNIWWDDEAREYEARLGEEQLEFVRNDLALVDPDTLVVAMMHIPFWDLAERDAVLEAFAKFDKSFSLSAHTHYQRHVFLDLPDAAADHHHLNLMTACGSWASGQYDELGMPHTTMRDGGPNGHAVLHVDGNEYWMEFKAARRPADYQMNIDAPDVISAEKAADTEVVVNFWAGAEDAVVKMRLGAGGEWVELEQFTGVAPYYAREYKREANVYKKIARIAGMDENDEEVIKQLRREMQGVLGRGLPEPRDTPHLWRGKLPGPAEPGYHTIHVEATDPWGRTHTDQRIIRVK